MLHVKNLGDAERELTDLVYAAMLGEASWQDFLDRLNRSVPEGISTLFFHDRTGAGGAISLGTGLEARDVADYSQYYAGLNPWMWKVDETPLGTGIVGEQIIAREEFVRTEYYADFLRPRGIEAGIGITLFRERSCSFLLSTLTSRIDPDENRPVADLLTRLSPHLLRAFRFYRSGALGTAAARFGISLLESRHVGVVIIGEHMTIRSMSASAETLIETGEAIGVTPLGQIRIHDAAGMEALRQMLARRYAGERCRSLRIGARKLTLIRAELSDGAEFFGGPTVALLLERERPEAMAVDCSWLADRFALTRAETRVAAGIVAGRSPAEIAARGGISRETVRGQLKSVYAKTGVNSQAALVRLALSASQ